MLEYWMGIRNPPKGDILAASSTCVSYNAVLAGWVSTFRISAPPKNVLAGCFLSRAEYFGCKRGARAHPHLRENSLQMIFDGVLGQHELVGGAPVRISA